MLPALGVLFLLPLKSVASDTALSTAAAISPIPAALEFRLTMRLVMAAILGAGLGKERSIAKHSAGVRTMALVAMGASAFTVCSIYGFSVYGNKYDPGRMASQVASGVGFLGAGVITSTSHLNRRNIVHGLTTAATIWLSAAVGVACGTGLYQVATAAAALTIFILRLGRIEPKPATYNNKGSLPSYSQRLSPMPASDWQDVEIDEDDDDCYTETHDTSEWDEKSTMHTMLNDDLDKEIHTDRDEIADRRSTPQVEVHVSAGAETLGTGRVCMSTGAEKEIVVDQDPEMEEIMRQAWQNNTAHQELRM